MMKNFNLENVLILPMMYTAKWQILYFIFEKQSNNYKNIVLNLTFAHAF